MSEISKAINATFSVLGGSSATDFSSSASDERSRIRRRFPAFSRSDLSSDFGLAELFRTLSFKVLNSSRASRYDDSVFGCSFGDRRLSPERLRRFFGVRSGTRLSPINTRLEPVPRSRGLRFESRLGVRRRRRRRPVVPEELWSRGIGLSDQRFRSSFRRTSSVS